MNQSEKEVKGRHGGSIFFMALIAVTLLVALSYILSQSIKTGDETSQKETSSFDEMALVMQYPQELRTALIRVVLGGTPVDKILFNAPSAFGKEPAREIFHEKGGKAVLKKAPPSAVEGENPDGAWSVNANFRIEGLGTDGESGNDVIAFLPGISGELCRKINHRAGIKTTGCVHSTDVSVPDLDLSAPTSDLTANMDSSYIFPVAQGPVLACVGGGKALAQKQYGCFKDVRGNRFVFYSLLLDR